VLTSPGLSLAEINRLSPLVVAYIGDAVFELAMRTRLATERPRKIGEIHQDVVNLVKAQAQAGMLREIERCLTEEELSVVRRGRNAKSHSVPRGTVTADYRMSTGFEALFGYLYLKGDEARLQEILALIDQLTSPVMDVPSD